MSTLYGENADKLLVDAPSQFIPSSDHGKIRCIYDKYTLIAAALQNDIVLMGPLLPAGARVVKAEMICDALDAAAGTADLGYAASADGGEVADPNAFINAADVTSAGLFSSANEAGIGKLFSEPVQVQVVATHAGGWDATSGDIEVFIQYVID